jgi:hypothetical protein
MSDRAPFALFEYSVSSRFRTKNTYPPLSLKQRYPLRRSVRSCCRILAWVSQVLLIVQQMSRQADFCGCGFDDTPLVNPRLRHWFFCNSCTLLHYQQNLGQMTILQPNDAQPYPLSIVKPGQTMRSLENNLMRAPVFEHQPEE